ncbi:MAG: META domain-containing protein [Chromatiales bacterium]|nr:META domain-containing protein [Chromatiales bacterium]
MRVLLSTAALSALLLSACAQVAAQADSSTRITGSLTYLQRIALPPQAVAVLELRPSAGGAPSVEQRRPLGGAQVPIPFTMDIDRRLLDPAADYVLRALIEVDGRTAWTSSDMAVPVQSARVELGEIRLTQLGAQASSALVCGSSRVTLEPIGDGLQLVVDGESFELLPVPAASGARYELPDGPDTWFWSRGERGRLSLRGTELPECVPAVQAEGELRAFGVEPGWSLRIADGSIELLTDYGARVQSWPTVPVRQANGLRTWQVQEAGLTVRVRQQPCSDTMTDLNWPLAVTVERAEGDLRGCGGNPAELLLGLDWRVHALNGETVTGEAPTLRFAADRRVSGSGGCNRWTAGWELTGESLTISRAASTMMACAEPAMAQERRFLTLLAGVRGFSVGQDGTLELLGGEGRITARPD